MLLNKKNITFPLLAVPALVLLLVITGCETDGTGDGGGESTDVTPPTVESVSPGADETDIAVNTNISITFSEEMDPVTITGETITVSSSAGTLSDTDNGASSRNVAGTLSYENMIATFTPEADFAFSTTFTVTVTTDVTDLAGNAIAEAYVFSFSTGEEADTTAPTVLGVTPDDGDSEIEPDTVVSATFSEPVDPATLNTDNIDVLIRGHDLSGILPTPLGNFELDDAGTTISFDLLDGLARGARYDVILKNGITDTAGNPLDSDFSWTFTTRAGSWAEPIAFFTGDLDDPEQPQVAFDGGGRAHVLWSGQETGAYAYYAYSRRYNAAQDPPVKIKRKRSAESTSNVYPYVSSNRVGTTAGVWRGSDGFLHGDVYTGGSWTGEQQISLPDMGGPATITTSVDLLGNAHAAWYGYYDPDGEGPFNSGAHILASRFSADDPESGWSEPVNISTIVNEDRDNTRPRFLSDPEGNAIAVWHYYGGVDAIRARLYDNENGWSSQILTISSDTLTSPGYPAAGADGSGNGIVVWKGVLEGNPGVFANRYTAGTGDNWNDDTQTVISNIDDPPGYISSPDIAVDLASGDAVAVWLADVGEGDYVIVAALYRAAVDTWKQPRLIATNADGIDPLVACDFAGNVHVLFGYEGNLYTRTYNLSSNWVQSSISDPQLVGEPIETFIDDPHFGAGPNGRIIAAWKDGYKIRVNIFQ